MVWGLIGVLLILWVKYHTLFLKYLPKWIKRAFLSLAVIAALAFIVVEGMIIGGFFQKGQDNLDYIIVLGAQLKENGPSYTLQMRLDAAYEYLIKNAETKVIVSGGQGSNEPDTEAQGMYDYLVGRGISPNRILMEDNSTNTNENIKYSRELMDVERDSIGIVTSDFHVFRSLKLAKAAGYQNVCGIAAESHLFFLPNNMLREFLGIVKDFLVGNLT